MAPRKYDYNNDGDRGYWTTGFREFRHSPCLMTPVTLVMFILFGLFSLITVLYQFPLFMLGLLAAPILSRSQLYIQFLYPWGIARWAHFFLLGFSQKKGREDDKNRGFHSRTVEQTYEVVPGRVYIHPIPQLLDNLGYLVVCLPPGKTEDKPNAKLTVHDNKDPIIAMMIDCGNATETMKAVKLIRETHYRSNSSIQIQSICSTHKHHDHTGGIRTLLNQKEGRHIKHVYGGAVERVPHCTDKVANGDFLTLPRLGNNDMNRLVEVEVVAVPAHTRGSVVYRLRVKSKRGNPVEYLFTGDTMFSAGGGVPFEADIGIETEDQIEKSHGNKFLRLGLGGAAIERCFAEIVSRAFPNPDYTPDGVNDHIIVFPGHEYTAELLQRQFQTNVLESCRWKNFPPNDFFKTVSQLYVSLHRRSLPHNSGKLLAAPSTLSREILISPHFRSLKRSADLVIRAVVFWYSNFCKSKANFQNGGRESRNNRRSPQRRNDAQQEEHVTKTTSTTRRWYIDSSEVSKDIFTTVYTADLESVIEALSSGKIENGEAIEKLRGLQRKMKEPVVNRRPIPGFLPSDKNIYKGIKGLALIGSPPSAMSLSDSRAMKLPPPIDSNSDRVLVSKKRLLTVLRRLGAFDIHESEEEVVPMINELWKKANEYVSEGGSDKKKRKQSRGGAMDAEAQKLADSIELGVLKWILYGIPANQPSWFSKLCCMPCSPLPPIRTFPSHPAESMEQKAGDLVSHDISNCLLCRNATGCVDPNNHGKKPMRIQVRETFSDEGQQNHTVIEVDELASHLMLKEYET